jgi:hypothetical protein
VTTKLLRAIRLDASDERVFARAAEPGEWAVPGGFAFAEGDPERLDGKARQAFRNGFLGLTSFGHATLVVVASAGDGDRRAARDLLARHFLEAWGAPDVLAAVDAAERELADAAELAESHPINTVIAVDRRAGEGGVVERFTVVPPRREAPHAKVFAVEGEAAP